jgi:hypothetical protein
VERINRDIQNMSQISRRIYRDKADLPIMLDLIANLRPAAYRNNYPVRADIEEILASAAIRANTRLWFDNDRPVGWAYVDDFNNLWWELESPYEERVGTEIVEWGESCIRAKLTNGKAGALDASCRDNDSERISFLRKHGFFQTAEITVAMTRDLSQPISEPTLPQSFVIRPIAGKREAEAVAAMHRAAFGTSYMTTENRLAIMNTSEYNPALDLVVTAPGGTIVANCICSVNEKERI